MEGLFKYSLVKKYSRGHSATRTRLIYQEDLWTSTYFCALSAITLNGQLLFRLFISRKFFFHLKKHLWGQRLFKILGFVKQTDGGKKRKGMSLNKGAPLCFLLSAFLPFPYQNKSSKPYKFPPKRFKKYRVAFFSFRRFREKFTLITISDWNFCAPAALKFLRALKRRKQRTVINSLEPNTHFWKIYHILFHSLILSLFGVLIKIASDPE